MDSTSIHIPHVLPAVLLPETTAAQPDAAASAAPAALPMSPPATEPGSPAMTCSASPNQLLDQLMPNYRRSQLPRRLELQALNYPGIGEELGLSQPETSALLDLLQQQIALLGGVPSDYAGGDELIRQEIDRAGRELRRMQAAELEALLGQDRFRRWQEYQSTLNERREVARLGTMIPSSMPKMPELSPAQASSLVATLIAERANAGARAVIESGPKRVPLEQQQRDLEALEATNARILQAARAYLSEQQLSGLQYVLNNQVKSARNRVQALRKQPEVGAGK